MSWITLLYETYNNLAQVEEDQRRGLLPIGHSTQKAHVTITLNTKGELRGVDLVEDVGAAGKNLSTTLIPVTESSGTRSNGSTPHPLCDKLKYVAGDYFLYTGEENQLYYNDYLKALQLWAEDEFSTPKVKAIYTYVKKGTLIKDLVDKGIFSLSEEGRLTEKWGEWKKTKEKLTAGKQEEAFIRFRVIGDGYIADTWNDAFLQQQYIKYYAKSAPQRSLCYAIGEVLPICMNHPNKIRNAADRAKLISSNDKESFTYRGRFKDADEAVNISYEVSQKAHNALKYLVQKQGTQIGEKVFLLWGTKDEKTPPLNADSEEIARDGTDGDTSELADTKDDFAKEFKQAILGYKGQIQFDTTYAIMAFDFSGSDGKGRLAVVYYTEYKGIEAKELIERINTWHRTTAWLHSYKFVEKQRKVFYGAPAPLDIALCAFGTEQNGFIEGNKKMISSIVGRLLPCISEGAKIPRDVVRALVRNCYAPEKYQKEHNWQKVLTITCAVYKKYLYDYEGEDVKMAIDRESTDIAYNCGRLLAVADEIERYAQWDKERGVVRTTNAMRFYNRFSRVPCSTWGVIKNKLVPYVNKLGDKGQHLDILMQEISAKIDVATFEQARNLDGRMALGFDAQKQEIWEIKKVISKKNAEKKAAEKEKQSEEEATV